MGYTERKHLVGPCVVVVVEWCVFLKNNYCWKADLSEKNVRRFSSVKRVSCSRRTKIVSAEGVRRDVLKKMFSS